MWTPQKTETSPELQSAVERALAWFKALAPAEQEAHLMAQKESWVRGEMAMGDEGTRATL